jgi:hypothetical protein
VRLELDINTVPEPKGRYSGPEALGLFREFVRLGLEISEKGDVP